MVAGVPPYKIYKNFNNIDNPPYNAYKNSKNIDNELGYYPLLCTKTPKIDTHEYVYQGFPPLMGIKTPKT